MQHTRAISCPTFDEVCLCIHDDFPSPAVDWFMNWIDGYVREGAVISDGGTVQLGWVLLMARIEDRQLTMEGPDFQSTPVSWAKDLTPSITGLMRQMFTCGSFRLEMDVAKISDTAVVGKEYTKYPMFMNRMERTANAPLDSGWFIGSLLEDIDNNDPADLSRISIYEAVQRAPRIVDFLALPIGTQVIFQSETPVVTRDCRKIEPLPGSVFEMKWFPD